MKVAIVFEPDPDLGPDPLDRHLMPRRLGEFLDGDKVDIFVAWREIGDRFRDGARFHFIGSGVWENLTIDQLDELHGVLQSDGLDD